MAGTELSYAQAGGACPYTVELVQADDIRVYSVTARWDGSAAAASFHPALSVYSPAGVLVSRTRPEQVFAAGDSGVVTYAPFLHSAMRAAAAAFPYMKFDLTDPNEPAQLWVVQLDGSGASQVTSDVAWNDSNPVVNGDGSMLVYQRQPANGTGVVNVAVVGTDGSGVTQLTSVSFPDTCTNPDYSPVADLIVYSQRTVGIRTMASDGSNLTTIVARAGSDELLRPQFNRDGTRVAYLRRIAPFLNTFELRCCDTDGSNDIALDATTYGLLQGSYFAWLNDADVVVYGNSSTGASARIFSVNDDGTGKATVWGGAAGDNNALVYPRSIIPDDSAVIAAQTFGPTTGTKLFSVALDGSGRTALSPALYFNNGGGPTVAGSRIYNRSYIFPSTYAFVSTDVTGGDSRTEDTPGADILLSYYTT